MRRAILAPTFVEQAFVGAGGTTGIGGDPSTFEKQRARLLRQLLEGRLRIQAVHLEDELGVAHELATTLRIQRPPALHAAFDDGRIGILHKELGIAEAFGPQTFAMLTGTEWRVEGEVSSGKSCKAGKLALKYI